MRKFLLSLTAIGLCSTICIAKEKKKNVLFILVDDLQNTCINAYGNNQVQTPNINNLVDNGVSFMHTHTNGSLGGALSMPSRAMLMTGRGVFQVSGDGQHIPESQTTLPEHLQANGYKTFATGKWHADKKSFNRSFTEGENIFFGGMHQYHQNGHFAPRLFHYDETGKYAKPFVGEKFSSELYADATISFLNEQKKKDAPFFAYVAFTSPHDPRNQHPDYAPAYDPKEIDLPINYLPQHPFDNGDLLIRDEVLLPIPRTEEGVRADIADYYGMVSEVDIQIGRILNTLKEKGVLENTIVVFTSDNGLAVGQHGLLGKQNLYEHSSSVPLVIMDSSLEKGVKRNAYCYLFDIYPTLCEMLELTQPESVTGQSFAHAFDADKKHRDYLFLTYNSIQRGLLKDGWKYIIYNIDGLITEQLFNLENDPWEMVNLAKREAYQFKVDAYKRVLKDEMKKNNDFCDLDRHYWWGKPGKIPWSESLKLYLY